MQKATISQLKARLSAYLRKVQEGETVLILDRDEPIARLERVVPGAREDDRLARLEKAGLLRRAREPLRVEDLQVRRPTSKASVVAALIEERRDGR